MAQLRDIYLLVKKIDQLSKDEEEINDNIIAADSTYYIGEPSVADVRREYAKKRIFSDHSRRKVQLISGLAGQKGYIKIIKLTRPGEIPYNVYHIEDKGWDLIQRSFFGILPKGLLLAWAEKNSDFHQFVFGFAVGTAIGVGGVIIGIIRS